MGFGPPAVNLHAPGPIGDTTPATIAGTTLTLNPAGSGSSIVINTSDFTKIVTSGGFGVFAFYRDSTLYGQFSGSGFELDQAGMSFTWQGGTTPCLFAANAITSGAAASIGTLTNAPSAGNPTCWIPINDHGTTRYVPAW